MADNLGRATNGTPNHLLESLGRLSKKSGVIATIIIDRASGAILTTTGSISLSRSSIAANDSQVINATSGASEDIIGSSGDAGGIVKMASMAWNFVNAGGGLVQSLDAEDEVKLLRLRTKKYELVIVPDSKYLLVAVHETPSA